MGENLKKIKAKKSWQPINIILGLLLIGSIFYFSRLQLSFIAYLRFIPAIVLILTRKNNILAFIVLFIFGLTAAFFPTGDGFLILVLAMYMFFSTILRMCKVKIHAIIGLIISLILGFSFYWDYARAFISENGLVINREMNNEIRIELGTETGKISTIFHTGEGIIPRSQ